MSSKDKRSEKLVVPYVHVLRPASKSSSMVSQTLPLAAMFMRNKLMSWAALFAAVQGYLNETPQSSGEGGQPGWLSVILSVVGLLTCYMDLVIPNKGALVAAQRSADLAASAAASSAASAAATAVTSA